MLHVLYRELMYTTFCQKCKNRLTPVWEEPCAKCLNYPFDEYTNEPLSFRKETQHGGDNAV